MDTRTRITVATAVVFLCLIVGASAGWINAANGGHVLEQLTWAAGTFASALAVIVAVVQFYKSLS